MARAQLSRLGRPHLSSSGRKCAQPRWRLVLQQSRPFAGEPHPLRAAAESSHARYAQPRPHAPGHRRAASTAEPGPSQRAAARPAPRARSAVAAMAS
jgi:hypothetical protein